LIPEVIKNIEAKEEKYRSCPAGSIRDEFDESRSNIFS